MIANLSAVNCPAEAGSLALGKRVTCTATYEITPEDYSPDRVSGLVSWADRDG